MVKFPGPEARAALAARVILAYATCASTCFTA